MTRLLQNRHFLRTLRMTIRHRTRQNLKTGESSRIRH